MIVKKCCGVHALRIAVGITMLALLLAGSADAANLTVCPSGCEYSSIQKAINASSNGDTILVKSGTYFENVNVNKQLTLRGIGNPVVDAGGSGNAITLAADGIILEGFTATGGRGGVNRYDTRAGIQVTSSNNTISSNTASNNYHGIYLKSSMQSSSNNTISNNTASNNGGAGIYLQGSSSNTLTGNNASNNVLGIGLGSSNNNTLTGNNANSNNWKGIFLEYSSNNNIYNNIFKNTNNFDFYESKINTWNITRQSGINIMGGSLLGGNFWANPEGTGFSQTCPDMNGDGICDQSNILDENNIDYLPLSMNITKDTSPPKSVNNLKNITYAKNYINWTWTDPKNIDFKKVMIFIDNKFKGNVSKGKRYYNATNFTANTRHTISTRTVDMNGNINKTWANHSAWTAK